MSIKERLQNILHELLEIFFNNYRIDKNSLSRPYSKFRFNAQSLVRELNILLQRPGIYSGAVAVDDLANLLGYWCDVADTRTMYGDHIAKILGNKRTKSNKSAAEGTQLHAKAIDTYLEFARNSLKFRGSFYLTMGAGDGHILRLARLLTSRIFG